MDWAQFKDFVYHMCLAGAAAVPQSFTQEVAGPSPHTPTTNIPATEPSEPSETSKKICNDPADKRVPSLMTKKANPYYINFPVRICLPEVVV